MMSTRRSSAPGRRRAGAALAVVLFASVLGGCATAQPGSAAVVGDVQISEVFVAEQVRALNEATGQPADRPNQQGALTTVNNSVVSELTRQVVDRLGISVPQAQVDQFRAQQAQQFGGEEAMQQAAAQQGLSPLMLDAFFETQVRSAAILEQVAPGATTQEEANDAVLGVLTRTADELGVQVAPRYGAWDPAALTLTDIPDPVSRPEGPAQPSPQP